MTFRKVLRAEYPPGPYRYERSVNSRPLKHVGVTLFLECGHSKEWQAKHDLSRPGETWVKHPPEQVTCVQCRDAVRMASKSTVP